MISKNTFNYLFGILLWLVIWFVPSKLNVGVLKLSPEYLLLYFFLIISLFRYGLTMQQLFVFLAAIIIVLLDMMRSIELIKLMPLGFLFAVVGAWRFSQSPAQYNTSYIFFIYMVPVASSLIRLIYPEFGMIDSHDTLILSGEETKRFNLLTYESNSVAFMLIMLLVPLLFLDIVKSRIVFLGLFLFICTAISLTFSRSGLLGLVFVLIWAIFYSEKRKEILFAIGVSCILVIFYIDYLYGNYVLVINRLSNLDYFSDTRGGLLNNALSILHNSDWGFLFGLGFWSLGVTDNTLLSLFIGYGFVVGFFVILASVYFVYGIRQFLNIKILIAFFLPLSLYMLLADIFGQAKLISVLALMLNISIFCNKR